MKTNLFVVVMSLVLGVQAMAQTNNSKTDDANFCRLTTETKFQFVGQFFRASDGLIHVQTADEVKEHTSRSLGSALNFPRVASAVAGKQFNVNQVTRSGHGSDVYIVINGAQVIVSTAYWASGGLCGEVVSVIGRHATVNTRSAAEILHMADEHRDLLPIQN